MKRLVNLIKGAWTALIVTVLVGMILNSAIDTHRGIFVGWTGPFLVVTLVLYTAIGAAITHDYWSKK